MPSFQGRSKGNPPSQANRLPWPPPRLYQYMPYQKAFVDTPSKLDGIDPAAELRSRNDVCNIMIKTGLNIKRPVPVIATSCVYFHRFFSRLSMKKHDKYVVAMACLFLAGKVEEPRKKVDDVIDYFLYTKNVLQKKRNDLPRPKRDSDEFAKYKAKVLRCEMLLLSAIDHDFNITHPYQYQHKIMMEVFSGYDQRTRSEFARFVWFFMNDSFRTPVCLWAKPAEVAAACLKLGVKATLKHNKDKVKMTESAEAQYKKLLKLFYDDPKCGRSKIQKIQDAIMSVYENVKKKRSGGKSGKSSAEHRSKRKGSGGSDAQKAGASGAPRKECASGTTPSTNRNISDASQIKREGISKPPPPPPPPVGRKAVRSPSSRSSDSRASGQAYAPHPTGPAPADHKRNGKPQYSRCEEDFAPPAPDAAAAAATGSKASHQNGHGKAGVGEAATASATRIALPSNGRTGEEERKQTVLLKQAPEAGGRGGGGGGGGRGKSSAEAGNGHLQSSVGREHNGKGGAGEQNPRDASTEPPNHHEARDSKGSAGPPNAASGSRSTKRGRDVEEENVSRAQQQARPFDDGQSAAKRARYGEVAAATLQT